MNTELREALALYERDIPRTDQFAREDLRPVLMGLFGEVGSLMAPAKKLHRERERYFGYVAAVEEEFGDTLWYFAALARRLDISLARLLPIDRLQPPIAGADFISRPEPDVHPACSVTTIELDSALLDLGQAACRLLTLPVSTVNALDAMTNFGARYGDLLVATNVSGVRVIRKNLEKTFGRFVDTPTTELPTFDAAFDRDEQLPEHFEIEIIQRKSGLSYLRWNGVFIGDPLTDNIEDPDGYRFHDVFHMAHAAILHWSPVFRVLIKHKRKSNSAVDEAQDGGRAIVVEEGLSAWLFSQAKPLGLFEGQKGVSFDLLKTIQQFVQGYEVAYCPLKLWEDAILQGYSVFRAVSKHQGGIVIGDRKTRMLTFRQGGTQ